MFSGIIPALITPLKDEPGLKPAIDFETYTELVEWQISSGVSALCVCGTTAEAATLDIEERKQILKRTVEIAAGRLPVIAGTGTNCTRSSIELSKTAKDLGADAVLIVTPYYNKPQQEGIYQHFKAINEEVSLPIVAYNIPGRSVVEIEFDTFERLADLEQVVAVKQAVSSVSKMKELVSRVGDKLDILAGECALTYAAYEAGGKGVISASANVVPAKMVEIARMAEAGELEIAKAAQEKLNAIVELLFIESNPAPAKAALKILGKIPNERLRLPLVSVSQETREKLKKVLAG